MSLIANGNAACTTLALKCNTWTVCPQPARRQAALHLPGGCSGEQGTERPGG